MTDNHRLMQLQTKMQAAGIDLAAIGPTVNMRYLIDYAPHADERLCLLLITKKDASVVIPKLNAEDFAAHSDLTLHRWADNEGPGEALNQALSGMPAIKKLAIDGSMRADFLLPLSAAAAPEEILTLELLVAPLRMRKSPREIELLAQASAQADRAMQAAVNACRPGVTEMDVAWAAEEAFRKDGAEEVMFTLVASGPNGAYPHHHSGSRRLQEGDAIILDIGASLNGYQSDITRMVFLGDPPDHFLQAHQAVLQANEQARAAVKPGVTAQEIDNTARSLLAAAGYGDAFIHRTGHGLGMEGHEPPWIMAGNEQVLQEGMVFSIEPGVYLPGQFGIRIEDIVVVTEAGSRTFTGYDRQLVVKK